MIKPVIAVDLDDTLRPWTYPLRKWVADQLGVTEVPSGDSSRVLLADLFGCSYEAGNSFANRFAVEPHGRDLAPYPDALPVLNELTSLYRLIIVTARLHSLKGMTCEYVERHFPGIFEDVIFASYQIDRKPKHEICQELGADIIIDDRLTYVAEYAAEGMRPILFGDYPWNRASILPERVIRARTWNDVPDAIRSQLRSSFS